MIMCRAVARSENPRGLVVHTPLATGLMYIVYSLKEGSRMEGTLDFESVYLGINP